MSTTSRRRLVPAVLALVAVAGCDSSAPESSNDTPGPATSAITSTLPLADHFLDEPEETTEANDLAPSQTADPTVPEPTTPDRCGAGAVEMWTAQVTADGSVALIRIRNVSDGWCDVDIGRSPRIDPAIEPDVWLRPGETADLVVGPSTSECADPELVDRIQVAVLDDSTLVPTALVTCGWWLTALYPNDVATEPCDPADLEAVVTAATVVIRNASATSCRLGGLDAVEGAAVVPRSETWPGVLELLPGDVVSFGRLAGEPCQGANTVVLVDGLAGRLEVPDVFCAIVFELGPATPWFGTEFGPPRSDDGPDADAVIAALDPFVEAE